MTENKIFKTLIKTDESVRKAWRNNKYVFGRISGMQCALCGRDKFGNKETVNGRIYTTECTPENYAEFMKLVEECYPGMCEFNYVEK